MMRFLSARATVATLALAVGAFPLAYAQSPTPVAPAKPDTMYFSTGVGSFKLLPPGPDTTKGTLDMTFEGTVMVSGLKGSVVPGPGVKLEYARPDHNRQVFFGKGSLHVEGEYRAIQFFGRNLNAKFTGVTVARLYGEFDKNMDTGYYWYASQPEKQFWGTNGRTLSVPPFKDMSTEKAKGKVRDVPAKKVG